ncbi:hypothetical protein [Lederbergia galactosidilytica]|uniref:Uncharacterized protein n=1 Tax=Lederbergia galactosidilytica TaxID=217031 RepID=A0A177ZXN9_9BACI|nr:hypothetical protein [Lederbergia galactosidilytica]OAK72697.1 hypothetical protein ABB05_07525 [Lederbergia galactosidilytica]
MKTKLHELFERDKQFGADAISFDSGLMINGRKEVVYYMIIEYEDRFDCYLNLCDDGEPPYRNILVKGSSIKKEVAQQISVRKLNKEAYGD